MGTPIAITPSTNQMGIELYLLPVDHYTNTNGKFSGHSHQIISIGKYYELFDDITRLLKPTPLPEGHDVSSHIGATIKNGEHEGESTYGTLTTDPYGAPHTYVVAGELAVLLQKHIPDHPATAFITTWAKWQVRGGVTVPIVILGWH